jgi:excisionase family DNA binding protein
MFDYTMGMTPEMVSKEAHLHINTVYALLKANKIPHVKLARRYIISRSEFSKWLAGYPPPPTTKKV